MSLAKISAQRNGVSERREQCAIGEGAIGLQVVARRRDADPKKTKEGRDRGGAAEPGFPGRNDEADQQQKNVFRNRKMIAGAIR